MVHRICHVQLFPLLSGVQRVMLGIFDQLDPARFDLEVVCRETGPLTDELERRGVRFHIAPSLRREIRPWADWRSVRDLTRLFADRQYDLVHTHSSKPGIVGRWAARRAGVPRVVHHVHGFAFHEFSPLPQRLAYQAIERWAGRFADRVIFVNHEERELAVARGLLAPQQCQTVINGIDLTPYADDVRAAARAEFRQQHALDDATVAILVLGRIDEQKQSLLLPDIAAALEQLRPAARWQMLVGGDGPLFSELQHRIAMRGLQHRVRLLGWQPEPHRLCLGCDVMLHPTLWEGLPVVLEEGHAAGLPAVVSDVKGNREAITPETGFLNPPRDAAGYARRLARWLDDARLRQRMSNAARRRAWSEFDACRNLAEVARLYETLLADVPPRSAGLRTPEIAEVRRAA